MKAMSCSQDRAPEGRSEVPLLNRFNVTAQQGNIFEAIGWNFFFGLDNAANAFFSPLTSAIGVTPSYMQNTPTRRGWAANVGAGAAIAATALIGPEGEAGQVAQIGRKLDYLVGLAKGERP